MEPLEKAVVSEHKVGRCLQKAKITALFTNSRGGRGTHSGKLMDVLQLPEKSRISQCLQKARITGIFLQAGERSDVNLNRVEDSLTESGAAVDLDALVPMQDDRGRLIPEWKRQVMVRRLQAHLEEEAKQDEWRYSRARSAILGPYGELVTEEELRMFDGQMEGLRRQRECQQYEQELNRQVRQLQALLPTPLVNVSVNTQLLHQWEDPDWCTCMSNVVTSMNQLLSTTMPIESKEVVKTRRNRSPSPSPMRELLQCGVSVRRLKGLFEKNQQPSGQSRVKQTTVKTEREDASDSGIISLESSSLRDSPVPPRTLRKERIVLLFLSHWKRSAYSLQKIRGSSNVETHAPTNENGTYKDTLHANSDPIKTQRAEENDAEVENTPGNKTSNGHILGSATQVKTLQNNLNTNGAAEVSHNGGNNDELIKNGQDISEGEATPRLGGLLDQLLRQRTTVQRLIGSWRSVPASVPQSSGNQTIIQSPEHFLSATHSQTSQNQDSLTLDLFMLGYFRLLEQELPEEERRMRHLLCFEVFDQLGRHGWSTAREFHCTVLEEIATGRRTWSDGFEDIKARFFGPDAEQKEERSNNSQISDSQDICQCIERSFTFWKEKEAEIFGAEP
ncbi:espin-like protein [Pelodytes ibericus]